MEDKKLKMLLHIYNQEQQILKRTDQKSLTILSMLGVFLAFFLVHHPKIPSTVLSTSLIWMYFAFGFMAIICLILVVVPRGIHKKQMEFQEDKTSEKLSNLYFGSISQSETVEAFAKKFENTVSDPNHLFFLLSQGVFSLGKINAAKNRFLRWGMIAFGMAVFLEFSIIMVTFWFTKKL